MEKKLKPDFEYVTLFVVLQLHLDTPMQYAENNFEEVFQLEKYISTNYYPESDEEFVKVNVAIIVEVEFVKELSFLFFVNNDGSEM